MRTMSLHCYYLKVNWRPPGNGFTNEVLLTIHKSLRVVHY